MLPKVLLTKLVSGVQIQFSLSPCSMLFLFCYGFRGENIYGKDSALMMPGFPAFSEVCWDKADIVRMSEGADQ